MATNRTIFKKIQRNVPLSKKVEEQLKEAILQNVYSPGERLPSELELVEIFGVSRTAIREALRMLAGQGFVVIDGRNGVYVSELDFHDVLNPFTLLLKQKFGQSSHLYLKQIRRMIEPEMAKLAALKRSDEDVRILEKTLNEMKKRKSKPQLMINYDIEFHKQLAFASGNPILPMIMEPIFRLLPEFISENFKLSHAPDISIKQHEEILISIKNKDSEAAFTAMTTHMKTAEEHVLKYYEKIGFSDF
jgi:GntR family transcriptional repressor for pyruvate dehydrogenase complex